MNTLTTFALLEQKNQETGIPVIRIQRATRQLLPGLLRLVYRRAALLAMADISNESGNFWKIRVLSETERFACLRSYDVLFSTVQDNLVC